MSLEYNNSVQNVSDKMSPKIVIIILIIVFFIILLTLLIFIIKNMIKPNKDDSKNKDIVDNIENTDNDSESNNERIYYIPSENNRHIYKPKWWYRDSKYNYRDSKYNQYRTRETRQQDREVYWRKKGYERSHDSEYSDLIDERKDNNDNNVSSD